MNIKNAIIKTNDAMVYLLFAFVAIITVLTVISGNIVHGIIFGLVGFCICAVLSGFWIVLSAMLDTQQKILDKLNKGE
jgi:uncharacterized membrane protein (DUF485 family)